MEVGVSSEQYAQMCKKASHGTKWWMTVPKAYFFGGLICVLGQGMMDLYEYAGLDRMTMQSTQFSKTESES